MYAIKRIPAELRRGTALGIIAALLTTAVMYSRNENAPAEVTWRSSKQAFQQPKDRPQAEGWFTPTPRAPEISDRGTETANAFPLPRARPATPGFYYELMRAQGDGEEGDYVLAERPCIPRVDMPEPCYMPERGRQNFPLRRE
jgi:hypothetical protein